MGQELTFHYDKEVDILYLFAGKPCFTDNYGIDQFVDVRCDVETGEIVGLTIRHCSVTYPELLRLRPREALHAFLRLLSSVKEKDGRRMLHQI